MIPPSPVPFPLWGSTFYAELTAGFWRALAAPWLDPGWPGRPGATASQAPAKARTAAPDSAVARPPEVEAVKAVQAVPEPRRQADPATAGQVIRVPHGRWRQRRGRAQLSAAD